MARRNMPTLPERDTSNVSAVGLKRSSRRRPKRAKDKDAERNRLEKRLEIGLEETFPASDAVAVLEPVPEAPDED